MPFVKICRITKETKCFKKGQKVFLWYLYKDGTAKVLGRIHKKGKWVYSLIHHYKILTPRFEISQDFAYYLFCMSRKFFYADGMILFNKRVIKRT